MLTIILAAALIISLGLLISTFIIIRNLLNKISLYEQWIIGFKQDVRTTLAAMRAIDKSGTFATSMNDKGLFESDDQVGKIFKDLTALLEELDDRSQ